MTWPFIRHSHALPFVVTILPYSTLNFGLEMFALFSLALIQFSRVYLGIWRKEVEEKKKSSPVRRSWQQD